MKSFEKGCFLTTETRSFPRSFQDVSAIKIRLAATDDGDQSARRYQMLRGHSEQRFRIFWLLKKRTERSGNITESYKRPA